jgi:hypothetical protein
MTNANLYGSQYIAAVQAVIADLENLRVLNDRYVQDNTLFTQYFAAPGARTDIQETDTVNAYNAAVQLLFTFDSGSPTQKSYLFKML